MTEAERMRGSAMFGAVATKQKDVVVFELCESVYRRIDSFSGESLIDQQHHHCTEVTKK